MRRAARRDANEREIIRALRWSGWSVQRISAPGAPDLICGRGTRLVLAEVKSEDGELTPDQQAWHAAWRGPQPVILRSVEDVIRLTGGRT